MTRLPCLLEVSLDAPLPRALAVGAGTALFVAGTCYCPDERIASLELLVDGQAQPVLAHGMPRLDFFAGLHPRLDPFDTASLHGDPDSTDDPGLRAYRSGFWGIATVEPSAGVTVHELGLRATLAGGRHATADLARLPEPTPEPRPDAPGWPAGSPSRSVAICMATYDPPPGLFQRQIDSIRAQSHGNWLCFISDDRSSEEAFASLRREVGGDPRFVVSRSPQRRGFFNNFERALGMAPPDAEFVAMADQDDHWYPDKLEALVEGIGSAELAYSDARIVGRDGTPIADSYWTARRNNHTSMLSLLVANSVTGAASLMRRRVLDYALPFPPAQFHHYHDHWVGLTALALGDITFVDRPLYDYVQHGDASLGHAAATTMTSLGDRLRHQRAPRERIRMWRLNYFVDACRLMQVATILSLRCGDRMDAGKRRALRRFSRSDRSLASVAVLAARGGRELLGRPETLGAEWMLAHAFAWRRLLAASTRDRPQRRFRLDAVPPPSLALKPARIGSPGGPAAELAEKIAPLDLAVSDTAPRRINVLIPTVDLQHFFGGYIAKLNLAKRLAARGARVRLVTVDPVSALPPNWRRQIESYSGLEGLFDEVEVGFGRAPSPLEVSAQDGFIATTWWTAHIAAAALHSLDRRRFVYLIQEYEPFTFPMGAYAALAGESYGFDHFAVFSTELLRDYFQAHRIGVFADGANGGSLAFENAITAVEPPRVEELSSRTSRKLLFYARPEQHAARNMFELGVLALSRAVQEGYLGADWELHGIGSVQGSRTLELAGGATLQLVPRSEQRAYAELLRDHDVGLALMYTPHPSLVPIEMASGGMLAVTNSFENKTPAAMSAISPNIVTAEPSIQGVASGLREAADRVTQYDARVRGSAVDWSRDWDQSFGDELLAGIEAALDGSGA